MEISEIKYVLCTLISGVMAFLMPIRDFMNAMVILFTLNYVFGVTADFVNGHHWSFRKSMVFFYHCLTFFGLAVFVFIIGRFMHNEDGALQTVSLLCYTALWFYSVNILRNLREVLIEGTTMYRVVSFIYWVVSLKMVEKIPFLSEYIRKNNK